MSEENVIDENLEVEELPAEDKKKAINLQDLIYIKKYIDDRHYSKTETDEIVTDLVEEKTNIEITEAKKDIADAYYNKTEIDANHYKKTEVDKTFYKKTDVDSIINSKIDTKITEAKNDIANTYYNKTEVDANNYKKTEVDETFYKKTDIVTEAEKAKQLLDAKSNTYKQIKILTEDEYNAESNAGTVSDDFLYFVKES